jgi:hypothetical protein
LYVVDRALYYPASELRDRNGEIVEAPDVDIDAFGNALGIAGTIAVPAIDAYFSAALAVPLAFVHTSAENPEAHFDRFGLADIAISPLQAGWRFGRAQAVVSYTLYVPSGRLEISSHELSRGQVSHQLSAGGTLAFDPQQRWFASALFSYDTYHQKRALDITRGDTLQFLGGIGMRPTQVWEVGLAGAALAQIEDDHGAEVPAPLRGARERVFALGPEVALTVPAIRTAFRLRCEFEFGVRARPRGQIVVLSVAFAAVQKREREGEREEPAPP